MRLSAPTNRTFFMAFALIVLGVAAWVSPIGDEVSTDTAFWAVAAGGGLLVIGSVFNRV